MHMICMHAISLHCNNKTTLKHKAALYCRWGGGQEKQNIQCGVIRVRAVNIERKEETTVCVCAENPNHRFLFDSSSKEQVRLIGFFSIFP